MADNECQDAELKLQRYLGDKWWRMNHLYHILDKNGDDCVFRMNWFQQGLLAKIGRHTLVRNHWQMNVPMFCAINSLDECLFNDDFTAVLLASHDSCEDYLRCLRYFWEHLPESLKVLRNMSSSTRGVTFPNGSNLYVGTSVKSLTIQCLSISGYGLDRNQSGDAVTAAMCAVPDNGTVIYDTYEGDEVLTRLRSYFLADGTRQDWLTKVG